MKRLFYSAVLMCAALAFNACESDPVLEDMDDLRPSTQSHHNDDRDEMRFNSSDRKVAVDVDGKRSERKNVSGAKITSNSHCDDFPGILFIWEAKHKDNGYLKVQSKVFEKYERFVLTTKEANKYWDFEIEVQKNQRKSSDDCYVFYIPLMKCHGKGKINMVFISKFSEKKDKDCDKGGKDRDKDCDKDKDRDRDCDKGGGKDCGKDKDKGHDRDCDKDRDKDCDKPVDPPVEPEPTEFVVTVLSGRDFGTPVTSVNAPAGNISFQNYWDTSIARAIYGFDAIAAAGNKAPALWVWNMANSLETGVTGQTVEFNYEFDIPGNAITDSQLLFAGDNAVAVWVNGVLAGRTPATEFGPNGEMTVINGSMDQDDYGWNSVVSSGSKELGGIFVPGRNTIRIVARNVANPLAYPELDPWNVDVDKNGYDKTNNAAGVLFSLLIRSATL